MNPQEVGNGLKGQAMGEYSLILSLVIVAAVGVVVILGGAVLDLYELIPDPLVPGD